MMDSDSSKALEWYVSSDGNSVGPVTSALVSQGIRAGKIPSSARVRFKGGTQWAAIQAIPEFARAFMVGEETIVLSRSKKFFDDPKVQFWMTHAVRALGILSGALFPVALYALAKADSVSSFARPLIFVLAPLLSMMVTLACIALERWSADRDLLTRMLGLFIFSFSVIATFISLITLFIVVGTV